MSTRRTLRVPGEEQLEQLAAWRVLALDRMPYLASILYSLRAVDAPGKGTFAVDEHHRLYVDFGNVAKWGPDGCSQALLHEATHLAYGHADEAREMNVQPGERLTWNVAADASANDDLRDAGCGFIAEGFILPGKIGCADYQTASVYMTVLRQRQEQQNGGDGDDDTDGAGHQPGGASRPDGGQGSDGQDDSGGQDDNRQGGESGQGNDQDGDQDGDGGYQGCGSGAGGGGKAPWELGDGDDLDGHAPPAGPGEKAVIAKTLARDIQEAVKTRGDMPSGLRLRAEKILAKPKVPWQRVLAPLIRQCAAIRAGEYDTTYLRRNRRRPYTPLFGGRVVNPGLYSPVPKIVYVRDTSGSMSDRDLNQVGAEIESVAASLEIRGEDLLVIDTDAEAYEPKPYRALEGLRIVQGRGGTDMRIGIEAAAALDPSVIVVGTDGETLWDAKPSTRIPVVACLIGHGEDGKVPPGVADAVPKWMRKVVVERDPKRTGGAK